MRVVAGSAGGIRLAVPEAGVRPTMDRVKAAIFSSLGERIVQARVLDLFAGTGALGIESLSRGAASVLFVEENRAAVQAIEQNLLRTKVHGQVRRQDVFAFLRAANVSDHNYDIIFADPPYEKTKSGEAYTDLLLRDTKLAALLAPGGLFVLEKLPEEELDSPHRWEIARRRTYGATEVLFLSVIRDPQSAIG